VRLARLMPSYAYAYAYANELCGLYSQNYPFGFPVGRIPVASQRSGATLKVSPEAFEWGACRRKLIPASQWGDCRPQSYPFGFPAGWFTPTKLPWGGCHCKRFPFGFPVGRFMPLKLSLWLPNGAVAALKVTPLAFQ